MDGSRRDPEPALSTPELIAQITELAGHLNAGTYRWLVLIAEFDRRGAWNCGLTKSCAHWLNWKCGLDLGAAREKVRVAHALESLPLISAAMARGELSYSKVRALTRVACAGTEGALLAMALHGTASQVEKLVRHYRHVLEVAELSREARQYRNRSLSWRYGEDGSIVIKALHAALKDLPLPDVSAEVLIRLASVSTTCSVSGCRVPSRFAWRRRCGHRSRCARCGPGSRPRPTARRSCFGCAFHRGSSVRVAPKHAAGLSRGID